MKFFIYQGSERITEVTADGYVQAAKKAEEKGIEGFKVYREDDIMPKPVTKRRKKEEELTNKEEGEEL